FIQGLPVCSGVKMFHGALLRCFSADGLHHALSSGLIVCFPYPVFLIPCSDPFVTELRTLPRSRSVEMSSAIRAKDLRFSDGLLLYTPHPSTSKRTFVKGKMTMKGKMIAEEQKLRSP